MLISGGVVVRPPCLRIEHDALAHRIFPVIIDRNALDPHILGLLDRKRHDGAMEKESGAVPYDIHILHVPKEESHLLVTTVIVGYVQEYLRGFLRIELVNTFLKTKCDVPVRMSLQNPADHR